MHLSHIYSPCGRSCVLLCFNSTPDVEPVNMFIVKKDNTVFVSYIISPRAAAIESIKTRDKHNPTTVDAKGLEGFALSYMMQMLRSGCRGSFKLRFDIV